MGQNNSTPGNNTTVQEIQKDAKANKVSGLSPEELIKIRQITLKFMGSLDKIKAFWSLSNVRCGRANDK